MSAIGMSDGERRHALRWVLLSLFGLIAALLLLSTPPAEAEDKVAIDQGGAVVDRDDSGGGMPSSNPLVRPILAAHPDQYVVICVGGCYSKSRIVQLLPRPATARVGAYVPSSAKIGNEAYGPPAPSGGTRQAAVEANDVLCVAGCNGSPGQVVQSMPGLPPPTASGKPAPKQKKRDTLFDLLP